MAREIDLLDLGDEPFVSLSTFRRNGDAVPTTVWVARDGDALIVMTHASTGKMKRLRNDPRVELRPSGRLGRVDADAPMASGIVEIRRDAASNERLDRIFRAKYGLQHRAMTAVEQLITRGDSGRLMLRITPA